jgi:hypothetical protein
MELGFDEKDVIRLMRQYKNEQSSSVQRIGLRAGGASDKDARLKRARWAIRTLIAEGFSECDIADLAHVNRTSITRALHPFEPRIPGAETVRRLMATVKTAGCERLKQLLGQVAIKILDMCCDAGREPDRRARARMESRARVDLEHALVFASSPDPLFPGVHAFLAQIGEPAHGLYLIKVRSENRRKDDQIMRLRLIIHEIEHLLQRVKNELHNLEQQRPHSESPSDGHIA